MTLTTLRKDNKLTMINYDTIISNFDDKVTLYNWLRKVEEALKNASATNFVVNKKGNATLSFSITFANGETLESGDIVLQQGESVDQARIASGVLQLRLTNGTWLTAGNIKPVDNFNIDANQHLIVNYQDGTSQDLGAIFNGNVNISGTLNASKITGGEITENMQGYYFTENTNDNITATPIYTGAVKNGNKLTLVYFAKIRRTGDITNDYSLFGHFVIPEQVGAKIFPYALGQSNNIAANKTLTAFKAKNNGVNFLGNISKGSNTRFYVEAYGLNAIDINVDYVFRFEVTFLLNESLGAQ